MKMEELKAIKEEGAFIQKFDYGSAPSDTTLAWVDAKGQMCHYFLGCKDYVHDILNAAVNNTNFTCCGYAHKDAKVDLEVTRLAVGFGEDNEAADEKVLKVINFIHNIERAQGFELTKLRYGGIFEGKQSVYHANQNRKWVTWVFEADPRWMHASPLISFYCMSIRMGFDYDGSDWSEYLEKGKITTSQRDRGYCDGSGKFWTKLIGRTPEEVFGPEREKNYPPGFIEHQMGFLWMSQLVEIPKPVAHWTNLKKEN